MDEYPDIAIDLIVCRSGKSTRDLKRARALGKGSAQALLGMRENVKSMYPQQVS